MRKESISFCVHTSNLKYVFVLQNLYPGILILGAVLDVHEYEVIFSLPFNMRGIVTISNVSDSLSQSIEAEVERLETEEAEVCVGTTCGWLICL